MTSDEIKAAWAAKITTLEQYGEIRNRTRSHSAPLQTANFNNFAPAPTSSVSSDVTADDTWFLRRELSRELVGVYPEPSNILVWMRANSCRQFFPHVSVSDQTMVAYTPDRQSGIADRQVQTTMGKLLRKFFLVLTDKEVARLEACHRAEMDGSFEMATTSEAIQAAFAVEGDSSCMRYDKSHWGLKDYHPSAVYCAPGMGLAVTRNANGQVNARSVIWTNPDNPTDKRYVRIYGDQALKRKLEKSGYRMAGLAGAKLAALKDSAHPGTYVMPWIDPAGGMYNTAPDRALDSCTAIKYTDEDFLCLVTDEQARQLQSAGLPTTGVRQQSGRITLTEIDRATLAYTCAISGEVLDRLTTRTMKWLTDAGVSAQASHSALSSASSSFYTLERADAVTNELAMHYCTQATWEKFGTPGYESYFNDEVTRARIGICELNAALYGEGQYHSAHGAFSVPGLGHIKKVDTMVVYDETGQQRYEHVGAVKVLRKADYVTTAVVGRIKSMSHTSNPALVTTVGGRKVLTDRHAVTKLHDGRWEYTANTSTGVYRGHSITVLKGLSVEDVRLSAECVDIIIGRYMHGSATLATLRNRTVEALSYNIVNNVRYSATYYMDSGRLAERVGYRKPTLEQVEAAVARIAELSADREQLDNTVGRHQTSAALFWAHHSRMALDIYHAEVAKRDLEDAEANAVEAPARLGEPADVGRAMLVGAWNDERFASAA